MLFMAGRVFPDAPLEQTNTGSLDEIVVTAEKRELNVQKSALTIEVLNADSMEKAGISQATDLQAVIPGLTIGLGGNNDQIFIRGVGSFAYSPISTPGVAFNVDGVYVGRPDGLGSNFYDLARVEVLKGPQGTLYGRNANGGSINVVTNEPSLGEDSAYIATEFGDYGLVHVVGAANAAMGDRSALRVAFNVIRRDGYLSDGSDDDVESAGRIRYKFQPNDAVSLLFNTDYAHLGGRGSGSVWLPRPPGKTPGRPRPPLPRMPTCIHFFRWARSRPIKSRTLFRIHPSSMPVRSSIGTWALQSSRSFPRTATRTPIRSVRTAFGMDR